MINLGTFLYLFAVLWVLHCINSLRQDVGLLYTLKEEGYSHYKSELTAFILSWIVSFVLLVFYILPYFNRYVGRYLN